MRLYAVLFAVEVCLVVYCVLNVITTADDEVRNLPKMVWLLLVLFFPLVGSIAWLACGRPQRPQRSLPYKGNVGPVPESDRPGRATAWSPDDDEAYLRSLRARADAQRKEAALQRTQELEREQQARRRASEPGQPTDDA